MERFKYLLDLPLKMDNLKLLEGLFDSKKLKMMNILMQQPDKQFYLRELSTVSKIPVATTFRMMQKLVALDLVKQVKISKFKLYQWKDNEKTKFIEQMIKEDVKILNAFIEALKGMEGVEMVIQHGQDYPDKANLLIIGDFLDSDALKKIVLDIQSKYNFKITYLPLTEEQYHQMSEMGLYAGQKRVIYDNRNEV